jgi:hypothetical protein
MMTTTEIKLPNGHVDDRGMLACGGVSAWRKAGAAPIIVLLVILAAGAYLRFEGLGLRSLWRDELCTWHSYRLPLVESFTWGPELSKPPLYQLVLRGISNDSQPTEWTLRFPAAVCGVLTLIAAAWLGTTCAGPWVGVALAGLLAFQSEQIEYSKEARPYSMLVLACTFSTALWLQLILTPRRALGFAYVVVAAWAIYSHYLSVLTILGHAAWWIVRILRGPADAPRLLPGLSLLAVGALCLPLVVRYLAYQSSVFQGLVWIPPATLSDGVELLGELTYGWPWLVALLVPAVLLWVAASCGAAFAQRTWLAGLSREAGAGPVTLLLLCLAGSWFGLLMISWIVQPALVTRYALPCSVFALLAPLVVAHRMHRIVPAVIMTVFVIGSMSQWTDRAVDPGIRELIGYLREKTDPASEAAVLVLDETILLGWEDSDRVAFEYYAFESPVLEVRMTRDGSMDASGALRDARGLWLIVMWADPFPALEQAGRRVVPIVIDGRSHSQLNFPPYRLVHVAPISGTDPRS